MRSHFTFFVFLLSFILSGFLHAQPPLRPIESISEGQPTIASKISPDSFVEEQARELKNADLLWVNYDLLRDMGIEVPPEGMTPEFKAKIIKTFAYMIPQGSPDPKKFGDKTKTLYSDIYGGVGMGDDTRGSGRAAGAGEFQIKGIGRTQLAASLNNEPIPKPEGRFWWLNPKKIYDYIHKHMSRMSHSHGGLSATDSVMESIWGEVLNAEMPYGANRTAFVLSTGNYTRWFYLLPEPRSLMVRQNSIRPAHFMQNWKAMNEDPSGERIRVRSMADQLLDSLPLPESDSIEKNGERLKEGLIEFTKRVGKIYGTQYSHSIFSGSNSPSNIEVNGRTIDYGPLTGVDGFTALTYVDTYPNGDIKSINEDIVKDFITDLRKTVPSELKRFVPNMNEITSVLTETFKNQINIEFLWLAGFPDELTSDLVTTESGHALAELLVKIAKTGNDKQIDSHLKIPRNTGTYSIPKILHALASSQNSNIPTLEKSLEKHLPDAKLRKELAQYYSETTSLAQEKAAKTGIRSDAIKQYILEAAMRRSQPRTDLFRGKTRMGRIYARMLYFFTTRDPSPIRQFINSAIQRNKRNFLNTSPYSVVLEERNFPETGNLFRRVFNAKTGSYETTLQAYIIGKKINIFGKEFDIESFNPKIFQIISDYEALSLKGYSSDSSHVYFTFPDSDITKTFELEINLDSSRSVRFKLDPKKGVVAKSKESLTNLEGEKLPLIKIQDSCPMLLLQGA